MLRYECRRFSVIVSYESKVPGIGSRGFKIVHVTLERVSSRSYRIPRIAYIESENDRPFYALRIQGRRYRVPRSSEIAGNLIHVATSESSVSISRNRGVRNRIRGTCYPSSVTSYVQTHACANLHTLARVFLYVTFELPSVFHSAHCGSTPVTLALGSAKF